MPHKLIAILILSVFTTIVFGQEPSDEYKKSIRNANEFYNNANYLEASRTYKEAYQIGGKEDTVDAKHRLFAAASNCMIDNEEGVKQNLMAIIPISTKRDMKKVLVNYEIFNKYKQTDWWNELKTKLDQRLADLIARHKNLKIFQVGRNLVYRATRVNEKGDTLANTFITMKPDGTGWGNEAATLQSQVIYEYQFDIQDSIDHIQELSEIVTEKFWLRRDTTGVIENEEKVWIHPMRNNEFFKTELAPFPVVVFPISKETMEKRKTKIYMMKNWGSYSESETENDYQYLGKEEKEFKVGNLDCHKFAGQSFNNFHGISKIEYLFNEDLGFVEMNYLTYDNDRIDFVLERIEIGEAID